MSPAPDERDRIRAAMDRVVQGTPRHSTGARTIVALAEEARLRRQIVRLKELRAKDAPLGCVGRRG
jgi:hypothetical protein